MSEEQSVHKKSQQQNVLEQNPTQLCIDTVSMRLFNKIPDGLPTLVEEAEKAFGVVIDCRAKYLSPYLPIEVQGDPERVSKFCCAYQRAPIEE